LITEQDRDVFTNGACWVLADALHQATGWQRVEMPLRQHVLVCTPDHRYLDIDGTHTYQELKSGWLWMQLGDLREIPDEEDLAADPDWNGGYHPDYRKRAEQIVPELLELAA
jgi:hypothetical protein